MSTRFFNCLLVLLVAFSCLSTAYAQNIGKPLAPFEIQLSNGKKFVKQDLKKEPVIIVYFSPDCGHCKDFTKEILQHQSAIKNKQMVMVTYTPLSTVEQFERANFISMFPNVKVGTEGESYKVMRYYGVRSFPYLALYDSNGRFVRSFEGEQPFKTVLNSIQSLK